MSFERLGQAFADHLRALGWPKPLDGDPDATEPVDGRDDYSAAILSGRFRDRLGQINPGPDERPWLDAERVGQVHDALVRGTARTSLTEANQAVTELLLSGVEVEGLPRWLGGRRQKVRLIDWDQPANNDLCVITNFRVDQPGGRRVVFDAVLFVNGIPLAVIAAPGPDREPAIAEAIADLRARTGQRREGAETAVPAFFRFVQLLVATTGDEARLGTITSEPEHFAYWRTTEPTSADQVEAELGHAPRTELETLTAGVLRPAHLLDLVHNFSVFHQADGRTMKVVARYPQFRAVHRLVHRLLTGRTKEQTGRDDERGGIVWHTQGSGKSLTMAFLVRKMRATVELATYKVVVVVDRLDLRDQLQRSLALTGETPIVARGVQHAREQLADDTPGVVTVMIQHAQRDEFAAIGGEPEELADDPLHSRVDAREQNPSEEIVLLVDEAHRSHRGWQHARLRRMVPNAARVAFTGTPLMRADKESHTTVGIFGDFIDTYRLPDSEKDGATVPIRYEQRMADAYVVDRVVLDTAYEHEVGGTPQDRQWAQQRWLTTREALEAEDNIGNKARDMLRHWVEAVLPNGFKAQVVAVSRLAAVRYRAAFLAARDELVGEVERFAREERDDPELAANHPEAAFLLAALPYLPLLRIIDFVPVISAGVTKDEEGKLKKDPPEWSAWTTEAAQRAHTDRYKQRMPAPEELAGTQPRPDTDAPWTDHVTRPAGNHAVHTTAEDDPWGSIPPDDNFARSRTAGGPWLGPVASGKPPIAFLIVKSMLLTGFDAPVQQALYLDRPIRDVELLQAIARTNRPARLKDIGLVIDYAGVARHLDAALSSYDEIDRRGYQEFLIEQELPELRDRREKILLFLAEEGIDGIEALGVAEAQSTFVMTALADPHRRTEFDELVYDFLASLDRVLPREQALGYEDDAKRLGFMQYLARRTYRDTRSGGLDPYRYGAKVRRLVDQHIRVTGIAQVIPPVEISPGFVERVRDEADPRQRALHMEHALRRHISENRESDPVRYERLSERLDRILERLRDDAFRRAQELETLLAEVQQTPDRKDDGLDPWTERPIRGLLERHLVDSTVDEGRAPGGSTRHDLPVITRDIVWMIHEEVQPPHFADSHVLQERLRRRIRINLVRSNFCDAGAATALSEQIMGVVRANVTQFARWAD
ncbi:type I restriction endonuclease subunit R [Nocardia abscessus]|uniref:type I restriction endonuclease subunit R n=1 Tax=Nocardia abscessus TaxID=120957 RepID=UPI0024576655|nr:HsdR family type I site-specific deoxyribonuclease [Nocardia abscessus]